ncbi:lipoprotein [Cupriavidus sp. 8B]
MRHRVSHYPRSAAMAAVMWATLIGNTPTVCAPAMATERPAVPEKNPPGDIPDNQVFVTYTSPLGFSLRVPEGWARTDRRDGTAFADKYNAVSIAVATATAAPAADHEAANLLKAGRAVKIEAIRNVALRSGPALLIVYSSNSEPSPVTNKSLRLESRRYLIYRSGKLATLDLAAPLGADNADQWNLMSNSFQWR